MPSLSVIDTLTTREPSGTTLTVAMESSISARASRSAAAASQTTAVTNRGSSTALSSPPSPSTTSPAGKSIVPVWLTTALLACILLSYIKKFCTS